MANLPASFDDLVNGGGNNLGQRIQGTVNQLAPFTSGLTTDQGNGAVTGQVVPKVQASGNFFRNVSTSIVHGVEAAPGIIGGALKDILVKPFVGMVKEGYNFATAQSRLNSLNTQIDDANNTRSNLTKSYYAGNITKQQYNTGLKEVMGDLTVIGKKTQDIQNETNMKAALQFATDTLTSIAIPVSFLFGVGEAGLIGDIGAETAAKMAGYIPSIAKFAGFDGAITSDIVRTTPTLALDAVRATPEATNLLKTGFNLLLKSPANISLTFSIPNQIYDEAATGKWGQAAANAALLGLAPFAGGPLGVAAKYFGKAVAGAKEAAYGEAGFVDEIGKYLKDDPAAYIKSLQKTSPEGYTEALKAWKTFEAINLAHFDGNVKGAVQWIAEWHNMHSNPLGNFTAKGLTDYWIDFKNSLNGARQLASDGKLTLNGEKITTDMVDHVGIGKFGTEEKYALIDALKQLSGKDQRLQAVQSMINNGYGWAQNPNMREAIISAVEGDSFAKDIIKVKTGAGLVIKDGTKFPRNYFPILLSPNAQGYDSKVLESIDQIKSTAAISDVLDRSVTPKAIAGSIAGFFTKLGLSPQDQNAAGYIALRRNIADNLLKDGIDFSRDERGTKTNVDHVLSKLEAVAKDKISVFDLRQLSASEVQDALHVNTGEAKTIINSIKQSYLDIPLQVRGLGNKIQDINSKINPLAAKYSRFQSAGRYAYNPFFKVRENIKSEAVAQAQSGGKALQLPGLNAVMGVFGGRRQEYDDIVKKLDTGGFFDKGSGRDEFAGAGLVGISAHMRYSQKLTAAGMTRALAQKAGMPVEDYIKENPKDLSQMIRWTVQYPKDSALNSPLVTTLNLVAFPARFNLKIATVAAKTLVKMSPIDQVLVVNSTLKMGAWLNSDEGKQWQARNTEALGVLKYFTPLETISTISKILTGKADSITDYGAVGGLPFGFLTTILQHQGVLNPGQPYINPRSGDALPDYIPKTSKASAKSALDDLISSVFSYPGAQIGLESKTSLVSGLTSTIIPVKNTDKSQFDQITPSLDQNSLAAQHLATMVNSGAHFQDISQQVNAAVQAQNPNPFAIYKIPSPNDLKPLTTKHEDKAAASGAKRAKKVYVATPPQ